MTLLSLWRVVCDEPDCLAHIGRRAGTSLAALAAARAGGWTVARDVASGGDLCPKHTAARLRSGRGDQRAVPDRPAV